MKRSQSLRKRVFERDNFICQKCKEEDKSCKKLEAHHKIPLVFGGEDNMDNLITLCSDCHHFAPNKKSEFDDYMKEECNGTMTTLILALQKAREQDSSLFKS